MRTVDAIGATATRSVTAPHATSAPPGTALVAVTPARAPDPAGRPARRALADFLAHLIATDRQAPQTRSRRRAEPDEAVRAYRIAPARSVPGTVLSRSL
jgi:hypothetical protein